MSRLPSRNSALARLTPEQRRRLPFEQRAMLIGLTLHIATQLSHLSCPWRERWQRIVSIPVTATPYLWSLIHPTSYFHWRELLFIIFRVVFFSFPLLRKAKGIQRVLDAPATPGGLAGFLIDVIKILWGTRMIAHVWLCISMTQSLPLYFIGNVFGVCMLRLNDSLCSSRLLQDPLTKRRLRLFNFITTDLLLPPGSFRGDVAVNGDCSFFLTLLLVAVGVAVPCTILGISSNRTGAMPTKAKCMIWLATMQLSWAFALAITSEVLQPMRTSLSPSSVDVAGAIPSSLSSSSTEL